MPGLLAEFEKSYGDTVVSVTKDDKTARVSRLTQLVSLGVKQGDEVAEGSA